MTVTVTGAGQGVGLASSKAVTVLGVGQACSGALTGVGLGRTWFSAREATEGMRVILNAYVLKHSSFNHQLLGVKLHRTS